MYLYDMTNDDKFKINFTNKECIDILEAFYWGTKKICPYCNSENHSLRIIKNREINIYHCNNCNTDYTVLVNTIFQNTKLPLTKWFETILLTTQSTKKNSARLLAHKICVTKDTALRLIKNVENFDAKEEFIQILEERTKKERIINDQKTRKTN